MRHWRFMAIVVGAAFTATMAPCAQAQTVDVAVALAADVSRSIDEGEFQLQRRGYAAAVTSREFVQAVQSGVNGAVALCFIEWAGPDQQTLVAKWTVIRNGADAARFARTMLDAPRSFSGRTAIGSGIDFAAVQIGAAAAGGVTAMRRVIDVSGDGTSNSGRPVTAARDDAVGKGITINGLAIINEKTGGMPGMFLYGHTHPPGGLPKYYHDNVIGGRGAFVLKVVNFDTFAQAMTEKLLAEISRAPPAFSPRRAAATTRKIASRKWRRSRRSDQHGTSPTTAVRSMRRRSG